MRNYTRLPDGTLRDDSGPAVRFIPPDQDNGDYAEALREEARNPGSIVDAPPEPDPGPAPLSVGERVDAVIEAIKASGDAAAKAKLTEMLNPARPGRQR